MYIMSHFLYIFNFYFIFISSHFSLFLFHLFLFSIIDLVRDSIKILRMRKMTSNRAYAPMSSHSDSDDLFGIKLLYDIIISFLCGCLGWTGTLFFVCVFSAFNPGYSRGAEIL